MNVYFFLRYRIPLIMKVSSLISQWVGGNGISNFIFTFNIAEIGQDSSVYIKDMSVDKVTCF